MESHHADQPNGNHEPTNWIPLFLVCFTVLVLAILVAFVPAARNLAGDLGMCAVFRQLILLGAMTRTESKSNWINLSIVCVTVLILAILVAFIPAARHLTGDVGLCEIFRQLILLGGPRTNNVQAQQDSPFDK